MVARVTIDTTCPLLSRSPQQQDLLLLRHRSTIACMPGASSMAKKYRNLGRRCWDFETNGWPCTGCKRTSKPLEGTLPRSRFGVRALVPTALEVGEPRKLEDYRH